MEKMAYFTRTLFVFCLTLTATTLYSTTALHSTSDTRDVNETSTTRIKINGVLKALSALKEAIGKTVRSKAGRDDVSTSDVTDDALSSVEAAVRRVEEIFQSGLDTERGTASLKGKGSASWDKDETRQERETPSFNADNKSERGLDLKNANSSRTGDWSKTSATIKDIQLLPRVRFTGKTQTVSSHLYHTVLPDGSVMDQQKMTSFSPGTKNASVPSLNPPRTTAATQTYVSRTQTASEAINPLEANADHVEAGNEWEMNTVVHVSHPMSEKRSRDDEDGDDVTDGAMASVLSWFWNKKPPASRARSFVSRQQLSDKNNNSNDSLGAQVTDTALSPNVSETDINSTVVNAIPAKKKEDKSPQKGFEWPTAPEVDYEEYDDETDPVKSSPADLIDSFQMPPAKVHASEGHSSKETPEVTQNKTQLTEVHDKCPGCRRLTSSLEEARELHTQVLKAQLLDKLRLVPAFKKQPARPKLPDQVFPQRDHSHHLDDDYYARPTSLLVFGRDLGPRIRLRKPSTGSYQFRVSSTLKGSVSSADLWVYKMKDAHDVHGQTLLVTDLQFSKGGRLHERSLVARLDSQQEEGWLRFDVTRLVGRWQQEQTPDSLQLLAVRCKTCQRTKYRAIFGAKSHFRPVLVLQVRAMAEADMASRRRRSACDPNSTCCLFDMTVTFHDIGIHEIFHPRSIKANYCYGTCERPDASYYNHTKIVQRMRYGSAYAPHIDEAMRERLKPCCVPVVLRDASVMHYINDGLDTQVSVVPNLLVHRCGCV